MPTRNGASWPERADAVRSISLEAILLLHGGRRDPRDKRRWLTDQGAISVSGAKFMNWQSAVGGGGAIDLVMHLAGTTFEGAVEWLEHQFLGSITPASSQRSPSVSGEASHQQAQATPAKRLQLPPRVAAGLPDVVDYLVDQRRLREEIVASLISRHVLYADQRRNAVFVMVRGRANTPVGAELRGTSLSRWRGLAAGTAKDAGYFWAGTSRADRIILCESAIDAISCYQLLGGCLCISMAGARPHAAWLPALLQRGYQIYNGFDADDAGNAAADEMLGKYPLIRRLAPPSKDWNDVLHQWR